MTRRKFIIPTLLAAGFGSHDPAQADLTKVTTTGSDDPSSGALLRIFTQDHAVTLANHSSHSSHSSGGGGYGHSSHMSHTSHRSSTGGGYDSPSDKPADSAPAPIPAPAPPQPPAPSSLFGSERATPPRATALPALSGRSQRFASIVRRVQIALLAQGLYKGPIDGVVGPALRAALRQFQTDHNLTASGTITPETLDALHVASQ
jgi:His-Xaa-Ser repeat protein HxsA